MGGRAISRTASTTTKGKTPKASESRARDKEKKAAGGAVKGLARLREKPDDSAAGSTGRIVVQHVGGEVPEGLPKKFVTKSTFNTHDIMHSPVEKTLKMIDKILAGERLFTM